MAAPITPLQLRPQDAPGLDRALDPLNTFSRQVEQALRGALTFKENHAARIIEVKIPTVAPWLYPTFQNSWTDFDSPGLRVRYTKLTSGLIVISGAMKSGTAGDAFLLPAGYRPDQDVNFAGDPSATSPAAFSIRANGSFQVKAGSNSFFAVDSSFLSADQSLSSNIVLGPQFIKHGFPGRCTDMWITSCQDTRTNRLIMTPGAPVWFDDGRGNIVLQALPELYGPATFNIRFLCLSEPS